MLHKVLMVLVWFPLTTGLLIVNLKTLHSLAIKVQDEKQTFIPEFRIATSSIGTEQVLGAHVTAGDARTMLLSQFLAQHGSPLAEYAEYILDRAEHYGIDYRLVPAIAMCESNAGKRMPSRDSHNAWGISVETGETSGANFPNWFYAIDWVSRYLKEKYYARGITNLIDIGAIYAPPSVASGNSWANCVDHFMVEIL